MFCQETLYLPFRFAANMFCADPLFRRDVLGQDVMIQFIQVHSKKI
jgi:hypothetical protein